MVTLEMISFIVTISVGGFAIFRILNESRKHLCSIIVNIMLGGFFFALINIIGYTINLNLITGSIIAFLGVPGVVFIIILKVMFKMF